MNSPRPDYSASPSASAPSGVSARIALAERARLWSARSRIAVHRATVWCARFADEHLRTRSAPGWDDMETLALPLGRSESPVAVPLDAEAHAWLHAHTSAPPADMGENTALIFANAEVQQWMATTLADLGWIVTEPVMLSEGWVPARGETTATGQPATTYTTASKTFARKNDPASSKKAGAVAAANQSVTVASQQGRLLFAYHEQHLTKPGTGYTAAEAVTAAGLLTDGATGSPWHRVTDLRDMGLLTVLLDASGERVTRRNESNSDGQVLVITPLGLRAAAALTALREHGYEHAPLTFDGPTEPTLFEDLATTLARITSPEPRTDARTEPSTAAVAAVADKA